MFMRSIDQGGWDMITCSRHLSLHDAMNQTYQVASSSAFPAKAPKSFDLPVLREIVGAL